MVPFEGSLWYYYRIMEHIPHSLETFGTLLVGFAALRVHHRVLHEHAIDKGVFKMMKREQFLGIVGVISTSLGFILSFIM